LLYHPFPNAAGVGDVTGDGRNDVVLDGDVSSPGSYLMVMAQNRAGTLDPPVLQPTAERPGAVHVRDLNGDGRQDVVVVTTTALASFSSGRAADYCRRASTASPAAGL
jgi:hypothetical protein